MARRAPQVNAQPSALPPPLPLVALVDVSAQMGGVEFSTLYLAEQLDERRFRRVVICPTEGDLPQRCREHNVPVRIAPRPRLFSTSLGVSRRYVISPLAWLANGLGLLVAGWRLARVLRKAPVALVCTKGMAAHFYGGLAARLVGAPCVWHVQDLVSERAGGLYARILGSAARLLARQIIVDGATIQKQLAPFVPENRLVVIHNGVDTDLFSPHLDDRGVRAGWAVEAGEVLVGNVARLTPWKGQDYLVRAFAQVIDEFPAAKLVLVGSPVFDSDAYERELYRLVRALGVESRVIFAGYRWDLPQVLAALDLFVHPSIEKDTSPLSVVSAMAAGKAIISTNVGGVAELFEPGEAILVAPGSVEALAEGLRVALADEELRRALGQAARNKAERTLSLPQFARRCEAVFERALATSPTQAARAHKPV